MSRFLMLLVENIDNTQRNQIQAVVKKRSEDWWHDFADIWVFRTDETARTWQNRIQVLFDVGGGCRYILLTLKEDAAWEDFGAYAQKSTLEWFSDIYILGKKSGDGGTGDGYDDEPPF